MNFAGLIYLLAAHYFTGRGVLKLFKMELPPIAVFCLSSIIGVPLISFAPCILQLLHIPITATPICVVITLITIAFCIPLIVNFKRPAIPRLSFPQTYEWAALSICLLLALYSIWRCFYLPPFSRDALSGPELIAEFTVREKTMINSVFNVDLSTSNNYYKSPYLTGSQIIYKLLVCPFGQVWLSVLFACFTIWIYSIIRKRIHPMLASVLLLLFFCIPEVFAYTFLILYDYSNMLFFFCGFFFLSRYLQTEQKNELYFSAFMFGLATYIRTETLVLAFMVTPLIMIHLYKKKMHPKEMAKLIGAFIIFPFSFYFICMHIFVPLFVPLSFDFGDQVNNDLKNVALFFERLKGISNELIFSEQGIDLWGFFIFTFLTILIIDIAWRRKFNMESRVALYGIAVVYIGLAFLGYLIPHVDLMNTTKRGLFKMLPLMLLYMANSNVLLTISGRITKWEYQQKTPKAE